MKIKKLKISQNACSEVVRENSLKVENIPWKAYWVHG